MSCINLKRYEKGVDDRLMTGRGPDQSDRKILVEVTRSLKFSRRRTTRSVSRSVSRYSSCVVSRCVGSVPQRPPHSRLLA